MRLLKTFIAARTGNFGMLTGLLSIPFVLAVGVAIDYVRYSASAWHLQELADGSALAMAASQEKSERKLLDVARGFINANVNSSRIENVNISNLQITKDDIDLELRGDIPATFMAIAGYDRLPSRRAALAERAVNGNVEVVLILDNTWSMSAQDHKGISRIATLKSAATGLVNELMSGDTNAVRIGLVPYADYVNIGTQYRNEPWLDVEADYTATAAPRTCEWKTVKSTVCDRPLPKTTCTRVVDGIEESYSCSGGCQPGYSREIEEYKEVCTGGGKGTAYKWFGCVGSRMGSDYRLHDRNTGIKYPGYVETSQKCLTPIVSLTTQKSVLLQAIDDMIINRGTGYRPNTYIPAGLVWGLNVLSPSAPLTSAAPYDIRNQKPRKVAVLMTDGENTLRYNAADGRHLRLSGTASNQKKQLSQTNSDTVAICDVMKAQNIEIFTIAFMVDDPEARYMLQDCATTTEHYFDASESQMLLAAFSSIGASLRMVRLAR